MRLRVLLAQGGSEPEASLPPEALAGYKEGIRQLILTLMTPIAAGQLSGQPPALVSAAVRLVGSFGKLLANEHAEMLEGSVRFVLGSLMVPESADDDWWETLVHEGLGA